MKLKNKDKLYIYYRDNKKCFYCDKSLKFKQITLDHLIPVSKGGVDEIFNIVTCCKTCNKFKGNTLLENYEKIIINLLHKAVNDNMIIGKNIKMDNYRLKEELLKVKKIENITDKIIFQSDNYRFYVKNRLVIKVVKLGGVNEYNDNFSWEN